MSVVSPIRYIPRLHLKLGLSRYVDVSGQLQAPDALLPGTHLIGNIGFHS